METTMLPILIILLAMAGVPTLFYILIQIIRAYIWLINKIANLLG